VLWFGVTVKGLPMDVCLEELVDLVDATADLLDHEINVKRGLGVGNDAIILPRAGSKISNERRDAESAVHVVDVETQLEKLSPTTEVGKAVLHALETLLKTAETKLKRGESSGAIAPSLKQKREDADGLTSSAKSKWQAPSPFDNFRDIARVAIAATDDFLVTPISNVLTGGQGFPTSTSTRRNVSPAQHPKSQSDFEDAAPEIPSKPSRNRLLRYVFGGDRSQGSATQVGQLNDENARTESRYAVELRKLVRRAFGRRTDGIEEATGVEAPRGGWRRTTGVEGPHGSWKRTSGPGGDHEAKRYELPAGTGPSKFDMIKRAAVGSTIDERLRLIDAALAKAIVAYKQGLSRSQASEKRYLGWIMESAKLKRRGPISPCPDIVADANLLGIKVDASICLRGGNGGAPQGEIAELLAGEDIKAKRDLFSSGDQPIRKRDVDGTTESARVKRQDTKREGCDGVTGDVQGVLTDATIFQGKQLEEAIGGVKNMVNEILRLNNILGRRNHLHSTEVLMKRCSVELYFCFNYCSTVHFLILGQGWSRGGILFSAESSATLSLIRIFEVSPPIQRRVELQ
jgi:hypothetical protein